MIRFKEDIELTIVTDYDVTMDNIIDETTQVFKAGEDVDADIFHEDDTNYVDIQFGDGSVALSVQRECFEVCS